MSKRRGIDKAIARTSVKVGAVALGMFAFGYALVPLYDVICEVTGLNGKTGRAEARTVERVAVDRWVTVEFTGNTMAGLPWDFRPLQHSMRVQPGQTVTAYYEVSNTTGDAITGQAVPSVAPNKAAAHFKKIECFCFTQQSLQAGESRKMPVLFVVNPELPKDVSTVTLSYAFFNADRDSSSKYGGGAPAPAGPHDHHSVHSHRGG